MNPSVESCLCSCLAWYIQTSKPMNDKLLQRGHIVQPIDTPLQSKRLIFEPINALHAEETFSEWQEPALYQFIPTKPPLSVEALALRYERLSSRVSPDHSELWLNWMLKERGDAGQYIGLIEVSINAELEAYLAYFVFKSFRQQGYAIEACQTVIAHLQQDYGVKRITSEMDTRNTASIQLVERLKFCRVGENRDADFFHGATSHEYIYQFKF